MLKKGVWNKMGSNDSFKNSEAYWEMRRKKKMNKALLKKAKKKKKKVK